MAKSGLPSAWTPSSITGAGQPPSGQYDQSNPADVFSNRNRFYTGAAGGLTQDPVANSLQDVPQFAATDPYSSPASWGFDKNSMNTTIYGGTTDTNVVNKLKVPVLVAQIGAKLGLKAVKGVSMEEQVIQKLGGQYGLNPLVSSPKKGGKAALEENEEMVLGRILNHVTGNSLKPGGANVKPVDINDPTAWSQVAQSVGVSPTNTTVDHQAQQIPWQQAALSITHMSQAQISQVQAQMYLDGFYDPKAYDNPKLIKDGNLDSYTVKAIGTMLQASGTANANGQQVTWDKFLNSTATASGYQPGQQLSAVLGTTTGAANKPTIQDTAGQLAPSLRKAFEDNLGFAPSAGDVAKFTSEYQAMQDQHSDALGQGTVFMNQDNVPMVPGIASPLSAAGNFSVGEYAPMAMAHGMANAAALVQNAMVGTRPLNSDPNITTAARQI